MRGDDNPVAPEADHALIIEGLDGFFGGPVEPRALAQLPNGGGKPQMRRTGPATIERDNDARETGPASRLAN